ncbi:Isoflavone reductase like P3 [Fusarium agapanthi]|uniref:Isoflavone reductase like P3 n=1 Tax=Fusarium agapanthi TaxID=1803897 RepID=A0A9P5AZC5_9HYPO|nr:Isoflavone reductase like P3 [Fusarium agapanthi]
MAIFAVAGGAGKVGPAIVEAIVENGEHAVLVLDREVTITQRKTWQEDISHIFQAKDVQGAQVMAVDYTDVDKLAATLETNSIDTVISTINALGDISAELNLIKGAEKSASTKRFIPSSWGVNYTEDMAPYFPIAQSKLNLIAALKAASSLEYTGVYNGYFADYWVLPKVKSYQSPVVLVVDIANNFAAIPGSGDELVTFTHTFDSQPLSRCSLYAEEAKGVKFTVKHDSIEDLKAGKITELPSHPHMYPFFPKPMLQGFFAAFGRMFVEGAFDLKPERTLNEQFPGAEQSTSSRWS